MTRGSFYGTAMPVWAIIYVIGIIAFHNRVFTVVGALVFALIAVLGSTVIRPDNTAGRGDRAARRAARRG